MSSQIFGKMIESRLFAFVHFHWWSAHKILKFVTWNCFKKLLACRNLLHCTQSTEGYYLDITFQALLLTICHQVTFSVSYWAVITLSRVTKCRWTIKYIITSIRLKEKDVLHIIYKAQLHLKELHFKPLGPLLISLTKSSAIPYASNAVSFTQG